MTARKKDADDGISAEWGNERLCCHTNSDLMGLRYQKPREGRRILIAIKILKFLLVAKLGTVINPSFIEIYNATIVIRKSY